MNRLLFLLALVCVSAFGQTFNSVTVGDDYFINRPYYFWPTQALDPAFVQAVADAGISGAGGVTEAQLNAASNVLRQAAIDGTNGTVWSAARVVAAISNQWKTDATNAALGTSGQTNIAVAGVTNADTMAYTNGATFLTRVQSEAASAALNATNKLAINATNAFYPTNNPAGFAPSNTLGQLATSNATSLTLTTPTFLGTSTGDAISTTNLMFNSPQMDLGYNSGNLVIRQHGGPIRFTFTSAGTIGWDFNAVGSGAGITNIPFANLTGLGNLATSNSLKYQDISGLGTLATSNSLKYQDITGLGTLATSNSLKVDDITGAIAMTNSFAGTQDTRALNLNNANSGLNVGTITNAALTASAVVITDGNKKTIGLANGGNNTVLHGTTPPAYSAVAFADTTGFGNLATSNSLKSADLITFNSGQFDSGGGTTNIKSGAVVSNLVMLGATNYADTLVATNLAGNCANSTNMWVKELLYGQLGVGTLTAGSRFVPIFTSVSAVQVSAVNYVMPTPIGGYLTNFQVWGNVAWPATTNCIFTVQTNKGLTTPVSTALTCTLAPGGGSTYTNSGTTAFVCPTAQNGSGEVIVLNLNTTASGGNPANQSFSWSIEWWHQSP